MITEEMIASIRLLIGVDESVVPDAMIHDPLIGSVVVREVEQYVGPPPFESRPAGEQEIMRSGAAYLIAGRLLGTRELRMASSPQSERFGDQYSITHKNTSLDIDSWRNDLTRMGWSILEPLRKSRKGGAMFTTAAGRRGA